jgi:tetratricopeptide (TPR) repeat protein
VALLEQVNSEQPSAVISEKLADLYAALGKPSSAAHAYEQALGLDPTPQQRVRLRLALGERLLALDRQPEAYEDYQKLLNEFPDHPDKLTFCRKLLALAEKLGKQADAENYQAEINRLSPPPPNPQPESIQPKPSTPKRLEAPVNGTKPETPVPRRPQ